MTEPDPPPTDGPRTTRPSRGWVFSRVGVFLQVGIGAMGVLVSHLLIGGLLWAAVRWTELTPPYDGRMAPVFTGWLLGLPVLQLLYVVPAGIVARRVRWPVALGVALGALLTVLLWGVNGTLYVLFVVLPSFGNVPL